MLAGEPCRVREDSICLVTLSTLLKMCAFLANVMMKQNKSIFEIKTNRAHVLYKERRNATLKTRVVFL